MASGSPSDVDAVARLVADLAASRPATLGSGRLICVDGPAGSGKTTLAAALATRTSADVVPMDDLMHGWARAMETEDVLHGLLDPLADGRPGRYQRWDWPADRVGPTVELAPAAWLVVEGVGCGRISVAAVTTVLVWVEVDDDLRLARGLARDGAALEPQWRDFMAAEAALFAREGTRERADVLVDGTGRRPPVVG